MASEYLATLSSRTCKQSIKQLAHVEIHRDLNMQVQDLPSQIRPQFKWFTDVGDLVDIVQTLEQCTNVHGVVVGWCRTVVVILSEKDQVSE